MKKKILIALLIALTLVGCTYEEAQRKATPTVTIAPTNTPSPTNTPTPTILLTEENYKAACELMYNDDFFKSTAEVGKLIKARCMISERYKYGSSSTMGIAVENITEKYNLILECIGCTVMHKETADSLTPSYFGKQIYFMFTEENRSVMESFKGAEKYMMYGEVIQNRSGTFVLFKYAEVE